MKPVILLALPLFFFSACQKKESVTPAATKGKTTNSPPTHATTSTAIVTTGTLTKIDSVTAPVPKNSFLYIDTFIGTLTISYADMTTLYLQFKNHDFKDYMFFVKHITKDSLAFSCSSMVPIDGIDSRFKLMSAWDTGVLNAQNICYGTLYIFNTFPVKSETPVTTPAFYTFQLQGNSLSVSWDDKYVTIPMCDFGESIGSYNGIRIH